MPRTRSDMLDDVRTQIADYVTFRKMYGPPLTFQAALRAHREVVQDALKDTPHDDGLRDRLSFLDELCVAEGVAP